MKVVALLLLVAVSAWALPIDDAEEKRDVEDFKEMVMRAFEEEMTEEEDEERRELDEDEEQEEQKRLLRGECVAEGQECGFAKPRCCDPNSCSSIASTGVCKPCLPQGNACMRDSSCCGSSNCSWNWKKFHKICE